MVWVLQLPDTTATGTSTSTSTTNVADHVSDTNPATNDYGIIDTILDDDNDDEEAATASPAPLQATLLTTTNASQPPSIKPELMTVSFALFCYVYMEALEVGMETTARTLRTAFGPLFQALYPQDVRDLQECTTTQDILRLNTSCTQYRDSHNKLRAVADQLTKYHLRLEYSHSLHQHAPANEYALAIGRIPKTDPPVHPSPGQDSRPALFTTGQVPALVFEFVQHHLRLSIGIFATLDAAIAILVDLATNQVYLTD